VRIQRVNKAIQTLQHTAAIHPVCNQAAVADFSNVVRTTRSALALARGQDSEQASCSIDSGLSAMEGELQRAWGHQGLFVAGAVLACGGGWRGVERMTAVLVEVERLVQQHGSDMLGLYRDVLKLAEGLAGR
jgi:hypothetical protein